MTDPTTPEPQATPTQEAIERIISYLEYSIGNPSAWEAEYDDVMSERFRTLMPHIRSLQTQLTVAKAENERLRQSLRFYAECNHINDYCFDGEGYSSQLNERGEVAQKALAVSDSQSTDERTH